MMSRVICDGEILPLKRPYLFSALENCARCLPINHPERTSLQVKKKKKTIIFVSVKTVKGSIFVSTKYEYK